MKLFSGNWVNLGLVGSAWGWDGPWTGQNYLTDDYPMISKDLNELNRDPRLTFIGGVLHRSAIMWGIKTSILEYSAIPRVKISKDMDIPKKLLNNVE